VELTNLPQYFVDCVEKLGASTSRSPQGLSMPLMELE
jgi:hypothetical protein